VRLRLVATSSVNPPPAALWSKRLLIGSEQSIRSKHISRKIVLSNAVAADRILHFVALVLPPKQAMLYLMSVLTSSRARADPALEK
jgi:hypothetical protein